MFCYQDGAGETSTSDNPHPLTAIERCGAELRWIFVPCSPFCTSKGVYTKMEKDLPLAVEPLDLARIGDGPEGLWCLGIDKKGQERHDSKNWGNETNGVSGK
jgi:hypothetical protein